MHRQAIPLITFFTLNTVDNTLLLLKEDHPVFLKTAGERGRKKPKQTSGKVIKNQNRLPAGKSKKETKAHSRNCATAIGFITCVQITTVPSCDALAIVLLGSPRFGAQATSRTQSVCLESGGKQSSLQFPPVYFHTFTVLSHPPEASFCTGIALSPTKEPGAVEGAQVTDVTPTGWAGSIFAFSHAPSTFCVKTEMVPSDDPHARHNPNSCGAQHMLFTEESCSWKTCVHHVKAYTTNTMN